MRAILFLQLGVLVAVLVAAYLLQLLQTSPVYLGTLHLSFDGRNLCWHFTGRSLPEGLRLSLGDRPSAAEVVVKEREGCVDVLSMARSQCLELPVNSGARIGDPCLAAAVKEYGIQLKPGQSPLVLPAACPAPETLTVEYWTEATYVCPVPGPGDSFGAVVFEREVEVVYALSNRTDCYLVYKAKSKEEKVRLRYITVAVQTPGYRHRTLILRPGDTEELQLFSWR